MNPISIESVLPELVTLTFSLAVLWLLFWLAARALHRWAAPNGVDDAPTPMEQWAERLTLLLKRVTGAVSLVIAILIMLHGVGLRGLPHWSWEQIAGWIRGSGLPLLFISGSALVLIRAAGMVTRSLPHLLASRQLPLAERIDRRKRVETHGRLLRWTITAVVVGIALVMSLRTLGVDVTPLLAGGAILSVALGFGAQNLVRDFLGGLFLIVEDQLRVGDIVSVNGKTGQVEAVHLRTTALRGFDGVVHIMANGDIKDLSNMTKNYSYYVIDLGVAYKENVDRVMDLLRDIGAELRQDATYAGKILAPLEVLGVDDFAASAVIIKLRIMTLPMDQWVVGRELRRRIKNRFDKEGVEIPYPHLSVYFGEASKPIDVNVLSGR